MNIILCIIGYFLIGIITGIVICKIAGKEWCRANTIAGFDSDAEFIMFFSTFMWAILILFSPFIIMYYFIEYIAKKLQE